MPTSSIIPSGWRQVKLECQKHSSKKWREVLMALIAQRLRESTSPNTCVDVSRVERGISNDKVKPTDPDEYTYKGEYQDGKWHGKGRLTWKNGTIYEGEFKDNERLGDGVMYWTDGCRYEGKWSEGKKHGKGTLIVPGKYTYVGNFEADQQHGNGKIVWENGETYEGEWREGKKHGNGILIVPGEYTYEGEFENNQEHGDGKIVWENGETYEGEWREGKKHGIGKFTVPGKYTYKGGFEADKRQGKGQISWENGISYDGYWIGGEQNGVGIAIVPGEFSYEGEFKKGKLHGGGKIKFENGETYEGAWIEGHKHGKGKQVVPKKYTYKGDFQMGEFDGIGCQEWDNGDIYEGQFENGFKHGKGKMVLKSGEEYDGDWKEDRENGKGTITTSEYTYEGEILNGMKHGWGVLTTKDGKVIRGYFDKNNFGKNNFSGKKKKSKEPERKSKKPDKPKTDKPKAHQSKKLTMREIKMMDEEALILLLNQGVNENNIACIKNLLSCVPSSKLKGEFANQIRKLIEELEKELREIEQNKKEIQVTDIKRKKGILTCLKTTARNIKDQEDQEDQGKKDVAKVEKQKEVAKKAAEKVAVEEQKIEIEQQKAQDKMRKELEKTSVQEDLTKCDNYIKELKDRYKRDLTQIRLGIEAREKGSELPPILQTALMGLEETMTRIRSTVETTCLVKGDSQKSVFIDKKNLHQYLETLQKEVTSKTPAYIVEKSDQLIRELTAALAIIAGFECEEKQAILNGPAIKFQSLYRGRLGRKAAEKRKEDIVTIQSVERKRQARQEYNQLKNENRGAIRIQAAFRGRLGRKEAEKRKKDIVTIQSVERGRQQRQAYRQLKYLNWVVNLMDTDRCSRPKVQELRNALHHHPGVLCMDLSEKAKWAQEMLQSEQTEDMEIGRITAHKWLTQRANQWEPAEIANCVSRLQENLNKICDSTQMNKLSQEEQYVYCMDSINICRELGDKLKIFFKGEMKGLTDLIDKRGQIAHGQQANKGDAHKVNTEALRKHINKHKPAFNKLIETVKDIIAHKFCPLDRQAASPPIVSPSSPVYMQYGTKTEIFT